MVIDCGETKPGGMAVGNYWLTHFEHNARTYRWYDKLFMPPDDLKEWQEINILEKRVIVIDKEGNIFEGWDDAENLGYKTLSNFATLIGKPMTIEEIKILVENENK